MNACCIINESIELKKKLIINQFLLSRRVCFAIFCITDNLKIEIASNFCFQQSAKTKVHEAEVIFSYNNQESLQKHFHVRRD